MTMHRHSDFAQLAEKGFHADNALGWLATDSAGKRLAMDAQPQTITASNAGIPAFLTLYIDPEIVRVAFAPLKAEEIWGPARQLGSWVDATAMFTMVEPVGEVSSYGDWDNNAMVNVNAQFPQRQNYLYQTIARWGELQMDRMALAKLDWATELGNAAIFTLNRFANNSYFFGLSGLQNYGILNDPSLGASVQPGAKAVGGAHGPWITAGVVTSTPVEIFTDVQTLVIAELTNSQGLLDVNSQFVLALDPAHEGALTTPNLYGITALKLIRDNYPNLRIVSAPQYTTATGAVMQLIATDIMGQKTGFLAYSERLRLHPVIRGLSAFDQKRTAGVWGAIIRYPFAVVSMLGI